MDEVRHGGAIDRAIARHGGRRADWLDLSTGINPAAWPVPDIPADAWHRLPDEGLMEDCLAAARDHYGVPETAGIAAAPGTQAIIQWLPFLLSHINDVTIVSPTYQEYERVFRSLGAAVATPDQLPEKLNPDVLLIVGQPNNPDGRVWTADEILGRTNGAARARMVIADEAFCDVTPDHSLVAHCGRPGLLVLKSLGKFFGLAGARLGFAIGDPDLIESISMVLGPWAVSGPALHIGARAMRDTAWISETRSRLARDRERLSRLLQGRGFHIAGATDLFVLTSHERAEAVARGLAERHILVRPFDQDATWLRFGLPGSDTEFERLDSALADIG